MKIKNIAHQSTPKPPIETITVELTRDEAVVLGLLSYKFETGIKDTGPSASPLHVNNGNGTGGNLFYSLPDELRDLVVKALR